MPHELLVTSPPPREHAPACPPTRAELELRLREKGLRVTRPRVAVLEFLMLTTSHPTAEEVGQAINKLVPRASRASVYNVLHCLRDSGLVSELIFDDAVAHYDANRAPHHHFVCRRCRRVEDVPASELPPMAPGPLSSGRVVESCSVTLHGLCRRCGRIASGGSRRPS